MIAFQQSLFSSIEFYACHTGKDYFYKMVSKTPDEDVDSYWKMRKKAEELAEIYGLVFVVYSLGWQEYRFIDWKTWQEIYSKENPAWQIGYYEKGNGWYD